MTSLKMFLGGRYFVCDSGVILKQDGDRLKTKVTRYGYEYVCIYYTSKVKKYVFVHSIVAECFLGKKPVGLQVNHIDGNKLNNCACNLEYCTPSENKKHALQNGLCKNIPHGLEHHACFISEDIVSAIRSYYQQGCRITHIAKVVGVGIPHTWAICKGKARKVAA